MKDEDHDELTRVNNRGSFLKEVEKWDASPQVPLSVIMGDINGLSLINERFGYQTGDKMLAETARIFGESCRKEDFLARIGDDEFCILLPRASAKTAQKICRQIYRKMDEYRNSREEGASIAGVSLGCHTRTPAGERIREMLTEASVHMNRHKLLEAQSVRNSIVSAIVSILYEKYGGTQEQLHRIERYSRELGAALDLSEAAIDELRLISILHDIGKVAISDKIINKNAKLTKEEKREIQNHPESGYRITQSIGEFKHISEYVLSHHEKWDGTGYPRKLRGEEIPLLSRIISIVDAYDAMTSKRPYREALPEEYAISEIKNCAGTQFDPRVARMFIEKVLKKNWSLI